MNNAPMTPEEFHIVSTAVLTGLLILVTLAGADWLKDYKRAVIPKDSRLKAPQKAFQAFSGIWLAAANFILLILTSGPRYTLPEVLQVLATTEPVLFGITHPLPIGADTYTQKTKNLATQSVHLHWQAIKIATLHQELKSQKWFEAFIRNHPEKEISLRRFRVENMHEALYRRAINEAEQAGWLAIQQIHRLNKRTYKPIPQNAHHASKLYDQEIIFLDSMLAWYHDDDTHAWLHLHKTGSTQKKPLRTRMKNLLDKATGAQPHPAKLPVDPILPDGHWETRLRLNTKNTTNTDCTPNS